jgi:tetratricopeptide (TPR) repeat protein
MKIKIKIKTLIFAAFILIFTLIKGIPTATLLIAGALEAKGSEKASLFYEKYAYYPTTPKVKGKFLYADSLIKSFNKYSIFLTGWGGGENTSPEDIAKTKRILKEIMAEAPVTTGEKDYYLKSYKMLLDVAIASGDAEMLREWIAFGQKCEDEKIIYMADVYDGFLHHINGDREFAGSIIEKYEKTELKDIKTDILKAEVALFDGKFEEAEMMYKELYKNNWGEFNRNFGSEGYDRRYWFERTMEDFKGDNVITGTVTYEGKPMPFVEIYVQEATGAFSYSTSGESYFAITDVNGEFRTLGLRDGLYSVGIGVDGSVLANKELQRSTHQYVELSGGDEEIHFEFRNTLSIYSPKPGDKISGEEFTVSWEMVEGAAYYTVEPVIFYEPFGERAVSLRIYAEDKNGEHRFTEAKAEFDINMFRNNPDITVRDEESGYPGAQAVLGIFLPGVEYPIVVNAFDENNNLITSSLPLRSYYDQIPSITVEGELTEGEKLIYYKNYPAAIEYYENVLKENPYDTDALRYLTRIYGIGWKEGEQNLDRAFELGRRYTEISGNRKLLTNTVDSMRISEIKENSAKVYSALKEAMKDPDFDNYYFLYNYYIAVEDYEEAREALRKYDRVSDGLVFLNIYFGDYMEAAENIKSKSFYRSRLSSNKVKDAITGLGVNPPKADELNVFNEFLLKLINGIPYEEGKVVYNETIRQVSNNNIKTILEEIYLERHWYTEY